MELTGTQLINQPRDRVWQGLNDPEILRQCIPGCDSFLPAEANAYDVVMAITVGPIKARFKGRLQLTDLLPPESYALSFDGSGGAAGFGKGDATVRLADRAGDTELNYAVKAKVGGRLAQVGSRLIDGVAKKTADEFFLRFKRLLDAGAQDEAPASAAETRPSRRDDIGAPAAAPRNRIALWSVAALLALAVLIALVYWS